MILQSYFACEHVLDAFLLKSTLEQGLTCGGIFELQGILVNEEIKKSVKHHML